MSKKIAILLWWRSLLSKSLALSLKTPKLKPNFPFYDPAALLIDNLRCIDNLTGDS